MEKRSVYIKKGLVISITLVMILLPIKNIFVDGIYNWHIHQKNFYLSGMQCIFFVLFAYLCAMLKKTHAAEIIMFFSAIFMLMQGIIVPYITIYVYFEMICFIGFVVAKNLFENTDLIINFITGLSVWGAIAIIFSLMNQGTINDLRIITIVLFGICLLKNNENYELIPNKLMDFIRKNTHKNINIFLICVLIFLSMILAAKSNVGQDYDSLWYMLKPELTLVGDNSFYDYLGYSAFVYYYPKMVEFFFLPISSLGDYSFLLIANVFVYNLFIVLIYKLLSLVCEECEEWIKLLFVIVLFSLPSLTSVVPSVKGDNFGAFLTMAGITFLFYYIKQKDIKFVVFSLMCLFLSTGTKVTFLLWAGIVGIIELIYLMICYYKDKEMVRKEKLNNVMLYTICSNLLFVFGIHLRTFKLTGYPIFPVMLNVWNKLGFEANYAIKDIDVSWGKLSANQFPDRLYSFFFSPNELSHTVMCWPTNIIIIFAIVLVIILFGKRVKLDTIAKLCLMISIIELVFAIYHLLTMQQPDGNYFYFPFLIFCITCFYIVYLNRHKYSDLLTNRFVACFFAIILLLNIPLMFVSNWCWEIGIDRFSTELVGDNFSDYKEDELLFRQSGYYNIAKYIEDEFGNKRIIASGDVSRIKGAIETTWSAFSENWCSTEIVGSYENFKNYVIYAKIEGFLLMNSDDSYFREYIYRLIEEYGTEIIIEDEGAIFFALSY